MSGLGRPKQDRPSGAGVINRKLNNRCFGRGLVLHRLEKLLDHVLEETKDEDLDYG